MEVSSLAEQMLFTTLRIQTTYGEGRKGIATGLLFEYEYKESHYPFLVTNKHVVRDAQEGTITFLYRIDEKPVLGRRHDLKIKEFERLWVGHPDAEIDVAVAPLSQIIEHVRHSNVDVFYKFISKSLIPSNDVLKDLDALEEVVFVGFPSGIWDSTNFLPVFRRGITATPIMVDFEGKPQFLIDASVFEGSSGSPVFIYNSGMYAIKGRGVAVGTRLLFVGIVAGVFSRKREDEILLREMPAVRRPVAVSREVLDLGLVFKASTIIETIEVLLRRKGILTS